MLRLFICIWPSETIIEEVLSCQEKLKSLGVNAKFVERENIHVTISFLGNVNENNLLPIKENLSSALNGTHNFHVKLPGVILIPKRNTRVVGIEAESPELEEIKKKLKINIGGSFHKGSKLTLCRIKGKMTEKQVKEFVDYYKDHSFGDFHVNKICLVNSTLTKSGPIYENIHEVVLDG